VYVASNALPPIPADCEVAIGVVPFTVPSETVVDALTPIVPSIVNIFFTKTRNPFVFK
jgi:hypothetical protein